MGSLSQQLILSLLLLLLLSVNIHNNMLLLDVMQYAAECRCSLTLYYTDILLLFDGIQYAVACEHTQQNAMFDFIQTIICNAAVSTVAMSHLPFLALNKKK